MNWFFDLPWKLQGWLVLATAVLLGLIVGLVLRSRMSNNKQLAKPDDPLVKPLDDDIKPRILINQHLKEDPCQSLDIPDLHDSELCPAIQEAKARLSDLPTPSAPEKPPVVVVTPNPKMTRADALKAANRNRQAEGRLKAQKAKEALDAKEDPAKVAVSCGYKTVKYMREKVRELEQEALQE